MNSEVDLTKQCYQIWQKVAKVAKKCYQKWQKVVKVAKKCQKWRKRVLRCSNYTGLASFFLRLAQRTSRRRAVGG